MDLIILWTSWFKVNEQDIHLLRVVKVLLGIVNLKSKGVLA